MNLKDKVFNLQKRLEVITREAEELPPWDENFEEAWAAVDRLRSMVLSLTSKIAIKRKVFMKQKDIDILEDLVDRFSVFQVVECLSEICSAKAEHIRVNWQDGVLAERWDGLANILETAARDIENA